MSTTSSTGAQGTVAGEPAPTAYREGGSRRIDTVLHPTFTQGLPDLPDEALRERRELAVAEEADLAYTRRLVDGRLDLLLAERARRERSERATSLGERSDDEIVAGLVEALLRSEPQDSPSQQDAVARAVVDAKEMPVVPSNVGSYHRDAERAFADIRFSDLGSLADEELDEHADLLARLEQRLSADRARVLEVLGLLRRESHARVAD
ncbi:RsiG family protein [Pseudokineococcus sp. 1T1Z-3]|uniref:RsiG family protein n=1 Tax=Pseudokineococcus sp. 1T1Z-3 TaxID=3132745 RepID=UPI0030A8F785